MTNLEQAARQQPVAELFIKRLNEDEYGDWEVIHFPGEIEKLQERIVFNGNSVRVPLYTEPPKRAWVGLTEVEMTQIANTAETYTESVKLTESKLKEKNT